MVPNAGFWAHYFREYHVPVIESFRVAAVEKLPTAFSGINKEADARAEAEYERICAMSGDEVDLGDAAELANERGLAYYETMAGVQQGVLNLLAVGLHHLLEQQQIFFLRRELARGEEARRLTATRLDQQLARQGIDCRQFRCAGRLYELRTFDDARRQLAPHPVEQAARARRNAIKHGAGPSAKELAALRPDLFEHTALAGDDPAEERVSGRSSAVLVSWLFTPLAGDKLYVSERDLSDWCAAAIDYWEELSTMLDEQQRRQADG